MGPCTQSGRMQGQLGYENVCLGLVQPLNPQSKGLFKQDLKELPASCKVRRVSKTHLSPRQHTEGLALLASDADSGESAEVFVLATETGRSEGSALVFIVAILQVCNVRWSLSSWS